MNLLSCLCSLSYIEIYIYIFSYRDSRLACRTRVSQISVLAASWNRNLSHNLAKRRLWLRYWSWVLILFLPVPFSPSSSPSVLHCANFDVYSVRYKLRK